MFARITGMAGMPLHTHAVSITLRPVTGRGCT
jgi:hypothetical protein